MSNISQQNTSHRPPPPGVARPYYAGVPYGPPRPGYPPNPQMYYPGQPHSGYRGPQQPANSNLIPMAHSMFHNAARMARNLPYRTDTPMRDVGPPSSDPPSSGTGATAPTSSSPPTPKDHTTIQVAVDPLFIDPALTDLPDSSSEPVLPAKYFEFADGIEKPLDEPEVEVEAHHPSVPPTGFVQRVKAMLESKAAVEAAVMREAERDRLNAVQRVNQLDIEQDPTELESSDLHEMAANETPRFTVIEEFEAPVELPASPVKLPELSASPPQSRNRLTRDLVKAELSPTSTLEQTTNPLQIGDSSTEIAIRVELQREHSKSTGKSAADSAKITNNDTLNTPSIKRHKSPTGSTSSASGSTPSPIGPGILDVDYALRFSVPADSGTQSEETQSRDPFLLDADTITLEHQRSKEKAVGSQPFNGNDQSYHECEEPISPLQPGEDVSRTSAVSPLQTQTLGIDETMRLGANKQEEEPMADPEQSILDVNVTKEEIFPPPTPRTPRTYSKSVQLPQGNKAANDTPKSNRLSLPPDLSTVADTSINTTTDMITDVVVRFSLPSTTVTVGKPQIVTIPPSSSPEKPPSPPPKSKARSLDPKLRRNSVTFADQVAPLTLKRPEPSRRDGLHSEQIDGKAKSIIRRPVDGGAGSNQVSPETTGELRFPGGSTMHSMFSSTHLPDLKEESVEDMSINEQHKRPTPRAEAPGPQLPARIAAVKAMQERRLQETADKAKARRAARYHNRTLGEIRDLPSLNFSRMDLIDKLNEALEMRPSKSMEVVRRRDFTGIYCPSPQRPQSTEGLRERYASFFSKPEDFSSFLETQHAATEGPKDHPAGDIPLVEVQESTKLEEIEEQGDRPLSPEDFLNVATQVNRLSIPSVTGLSERLTSLLPCLRNLHLDSVVATDEEVAHTIDDIHQLGQIARPDTVLSTRTSAGFRTLAERAEEIVLNGTHDSIVPASKGLTNNKELPALPESHSADKVSAVNSMDGKQSYLSGSVSAPSELGKELPNRPSSALVRRTPANEEDVLQLLPPEMNPITRAKRSLVISSASRPWNQDENYPWAGTNVPVDLTIPSDVHAHDSTAGDSTCAGKSTEGTTGDELADTSKGIDIGSIITTNDCSASITTEQATGVKATHLRKQSKRSIIGSLSKKIGLNVRHHTDETTRTVPSPGLRSDENTQPHKPGDRYPTSALTPPANFQIDEVRSFFSDNSSERQRNSALPKRLTRLRKHKAVRLDVTRGTTSLDGNTTYDAGSLSAERLGATSSAQTYDGVVGMGKTEFRIKRFGEKLRLIFVKGGELIRSLSTRSKVLRGERARDGWLADSLYSGV